MKEQFRQKMLPNTFLISKLVQLDGVAAISNKKDVLGMELAYLDHARVAIDVVRSGVIWMYVTHRLGLFVHVACLSCSQPDPTYYHNFKALDTIGNYSK